MKIIRFQEEPVHPESINQSLHSTENGALVTFTGQARDRSRGKDVTHLFYEIYDEMANREMEKIVDEALEKWDITGCGVVHRYGRVEAGETSIHIAVTSAHRDDSFQACRFIIDEIKKRVPVWKQEWYRDGSRWITEGS
jgi:molybdopterin synthase catalytic subunit